LVFILRGIEADGENPHDIEYVPIIGLTRDEKGKIQFKSNLVPADRMVLFHKLKNILRW